MSVLFNVFCMKGEHMMEEMKEFSAYKLNFFQKLYRLVKGLFDFFIALIALIILIPGFIIVAIAIKLDSKGSVFFLQKRIGKKGKIFNCVKFRTMSVDANHAVAGYEYKEVNSYITKVGRFLRKWSIDELPQLYNILTFKVSLIGYRPSQMCEEELNTEREKYNMYQIRPGISGWAQVNGRDLLAAHPKKKAEFDAYYLKKFSPWLDLKILFMTFVKVFKNDGVQEGVLSVENPANSNAIVVNSENSEVAVSLDKDSLPKNKKSEEIA